jgi:HAMP domain-containing protein
MANTVGIIPKTLIPSVVIAGAFSAVVFFVIKQDANEAAKRQAISTARAVSDQVIAMRKVYTQDVVGKLRTGDGMETTPLTLTAKPIGEFRNIPGAMPLPATIVHLVSAEVNKSATGHTVDLVSEWNLNKDKGLSTDFQRDAFRQLKSSVANGDAQNMPNEIVNESDGVRFYAARADLASTDACVSCHNKLGATGAGGGKADFKKDDLMGAIMVSIPLQAEVAQAEASAKRLTFIILGGFVGVLIIQLLLQWFLVGKRVLTGLSDLQSAAERISLGEVHEPIKVTGEDEVGRLGKAFERMRVSLANAMDELEKGGGA